MKFTVFGSTGFVGSHLVRHLRFAGHEVVTPLRGELLRPNEHLGHVIYAIGLTGDFRHRPYETVDAHVTKLAGLLKSSSYDSWLYISSTRVYGTSDSVGKETNLIRVAPGADGIYNISKLLGEALCLAIERPTVRVVRLANVYGCGQSQHTFLGSLLRDLALRQPIVIQEDSESSKDYIAISDVVDLLGKIAIKGSDRVYNLASGKTISHRILGNRIEVLTGTPVKFLVNGPRRVFPSINVDRITQEFDFSPRCLLDDFSELIVAN